MPVRWSRLNRRIGSAEGIGAEKMWSGRCGSRGRFPAPSTALGTVLVGPAGPAGAPSAPSAPGMLPDPDKLPLSEASKRT